MVPNSGRRISDSGSPNYSYPPRHLSASTHLPSIHALAIYYVSLIKNRSSNVLLPPLHMNSVTDCVSTPKMSCRSCVVKAISMHVCHPQPTGSTRYMNILCKSMRKYKNKLGTSPFPPHSIVFATWPPWREQNRRSIR